MSCFSCIELRYLLLQDGSGFNLFDINPPTFANGTKIPNGEYKILLRALKVTGNPANEADFESWLSPVIGVQVASNVDVESLL